MDPVVAAESLTERVHDQVRQAIITGEMAPGSLHSIYKLAEELGVSRTPVREALLQLAEQGMVRFERNRGVRVLETSLRDLEEIFSLRLLLEIPATYRAASRISDENVAQMRASLNDMRHAASRGDAREFMAHDRALHRLIADTAGNRRLATIIDDIRDLVLNRGVSTAGRSRGLEDIISEHESVVDALEDRDGDRAATEMLSHLLNTARLLLSQEARVDPETIVLPWAEYVSKRAAKA